jgi:hypothetical protein
MSKELLKCFYCEVSQGMIYSFKITYSRKKGAVHFEPLGELRLDCYSCGKSSYFKRNTEGKLINIKESAYNQSAIIEHSDC